MFKPLEGFAVVLALLSAGFAAPALAGQPAASVGSPVSSLPGPVGEILTGDPTVLINGLPAARVGDTARCFIPGPFGGPIPTVQQIVTGNGSVLIGGAPAASLGDSISGGCTILNGSTNVFD